MKKSIIRRRLLYKKLHPVLKQAHPETIEKATLIISLAEKDYTLEQIGKHLGISRQRVYQIVQQANMEPILKVVYIQRMANRKMAKIEVKFKNCATCGIRFFPRRDIHSRQCCSLECEKERKRKWWREYKRRKHRDDKDFKILTSAKDYMHRHKRELDIV